MFVDVENNKTWTGYKNVSNKSKANVKVVLNKDNVAEIVFMYGDDMSSSANDDDFVILKGTGLESVKDANKKTVYRFTDAYDVNGEKINDLYAADPDVLKADNGAKMGKGLFLIKNYNSDDYVTKMVRCYSIDDLGDAGFSADTYAKAAKNGVLTLNKAIDLNKDGSQVKDTFAYDSKTTFIVIEQKQSGDVDTIRTGDIGDIVSYADANVVTDSKGNKTSDMTGVYVITVDNDTDDTPLAESILVVVPYVK